MTPHEFLAAPPNEIVKFPAPILLAKAAFITDLAPWKEIGEIAHALMVADRGIGLAAPQIGLSYRAFVIRRGKSFLTVINPEILEYGEQKVKMAEGCLSIPGVTIEMERSSGIKAKWTDENGKEQKETFDGMTARCFQHEFDHLDGLIITRVFECSTQNASQERVSALTPSR